MKNTHFLKINKQKSVMLFGLIFTFLSFFSLPQISSASMLLPGNITTCGELGSAGEYILTADVSVSGTSTCFTVSSDNVTITGNNHTITGGGTGTGAIAIDARARTGGPEGTLTEGSDGYTNLIINNLIISNFTTGINTSGNADTTGSGIKAGNGGDAGDVAIYYAVVGSITAEGGNSTTTAYGGVGGNIYFTDTNLDISNSTFALRGGVGTTGRNTDGGLDLNYTGTLTKTDVALSSLGFFNDNLIAYGVYVGGTWPLTSGTISSCGTLYSNSTTTAVFTLTQNLTSHSTCFTINGHNIVLDQAGYTINSTDASTTDFAIDVSNFSNFTLASTTVTNYSNLINSSSSVTISGNNLDLSNKYIKAGSLILNYDGTLDKTGATVSALTSLIVNGVDYGPYVGGVFPATPTSISECGTLVGSGTYILSQDITGVNGTCFTIASNNITLNGAGHSITSASPSNVNFAINAGSYSGFILASTTVVDFPNFITASSSVSIVSSGNLDLSNKYLNVGSLNLTYHGALSTASTTLSALSALTVNGISYGAISAGSFPSGVWRVAGEKTDWTGVASSADGVKSFMVSYSGYIKTSTDSGLTWVTRSAQGGGRIFRGAASSADGVRLVAVTQNGTVWTSTNSGVSWNIQSAAPSKVWNGVTSDVSGLKLAAIVNGGYIYTSNDGGATWTERQGSGSRAWQQEGITSSADGTKLAAVASGGYIYTSNDGGVTWSERTSAGMRSWVSITSDSTGFKLASLDYNSGSIWTSSDGGDNWMEIPNTSGHTWYSIASSADGTKLIAGTNGEKVWMSQDSGATWTLFSNLPNEYYQFLTVSADGNKFSSVGWLNNYTYTTINPALKVDILTPLNNEVVTAWSPFIAWGTATVCEYSWDGISWISSVCANNGSDISVPPVGTSTLQVRGTDAMGVTVTKNTTFRRDLSVSINFPISGSAVKTWTPSVNWDFANTGTDTLNCTYSYNNFSTSATSSCSLGGSDILAPVLEGNNILSVKVIDDNGNVATANVVFSSGWALVPNTVYSYEGVASDASGTKLATALSNGKVYTSTNSGVTWNLQSGSPTTGGFSRMTSSADGNKLVLVDQGGYIYTSADSGVTWITRTSAGLRNWKGVASSADGNRLVAINNGGYIYTSTDSGVTWATSTNSGARSWEGITSDASGLKIAAVNAQTWGNGNIWTSQNGGATWTNVSSANGRYFVLITSSANGNNLAALGWGGSIWTSSNSGTTWVQSPGTSGGQWQSITSSADGSKLFANNWGGSIYYSTNFGASWSQSVNTSPNNWTTTVSSADGNKAFAVSKSWSLWTYSSLNPVLKVNILIPSATTTMTKWNPYVSWGTATVCEYSWDNWSTTNTAVCSNNGSDISTPSFGTSTLSVRGTDINNTLAEKTVTFSFIYYAWYSTVDAVWNNISNWFTDTTHTVQAPSLPTADIGTVLVGTTSPVVDLDTWVEPVNINASALTGEGGINGVIFTSATGRCFTSDLVGNAVFNGNSCNNGSITGNVVFNDTSYNGIDGDITGNVKLNTTYYGSVASTTLLLGGSAVWGGTIGGAITSSDDSIIDSFIFNDSSSNRAIITSTTTTVFNNSSTNLGTINGNVTFNNTSPFSIGTVNGTVTLNGFSQVLSGVNNVTNFIKQIASAVRDTLYFTSGSILNISGSTTILGNSANNLLTIRSTSPNSYASLGINGSSTLNYLRIKDIHNIGPSIDLSSKTVYDDGGNSGFTFPANSTPDSRSGGIANTYTPPPVPDSRIPVVPANPSAGNNNNGNAGGTSGGSFLYSNLNSKNVGKLDLSNLPKFGLNLGNNFGTSKFVNPLTNMVRLRPIGNFSELPKINWTNKLSNVAFNSLPKSLAVLAGSIPSIKKELSTAGIINGYDLYSMPESPIEVPTLTDLSKEGIPQPTNLLFISVDGTEIKTKLSIDKRGNTYQTINVDPYSYLYVNVKNADKNVRAVFNNENIKMVRLGNNVKLNFMVPKDIGTYSLKVGDLVLEVRVVEKGSLPTINTEKDVPSTIISASSTADVPAKTKTKNLTPIQKLWSWFSK